MAKYSKPKRKASADRETENNGSGIQATDSWINVKGKAVYVNIPEKDVKLVKNGKYGKRVSFITSLDSLQRLVDGEIGGVNLGTFEE